MREVFRPKIISLAMTSRCNLRCVMCDHGIRNVEKQDFDEALFANIGDFIDTATMVDLTGLGEPLLSNLFWKILDRHPVSETTADDEFILTFNTNGTLLNERNIDRILSARVSKIRVSIDAADEATFQKIRGTKLSEIVVGTQRLIEKRNSLHRVRPRIAIEMTVMKETLGKVPAMVDLCKKIGADFLEVWSLNSYPEHTMKDWIVMKNDWTFSYPDQSLASIPHDDLIEAVDSYHRYADERQVPIASYVEGIRKASDNFPRETGIVSLISGEGFARPPIPWRDDSLKCDMPWQELRITYEGDVYACCWQPGPIGNIREATLESVWNGEAMRELRQELIDGKIPKLCSGAACSHVKGQLALEVESVTISSRGPLARMWRAVSAAFTSS